MPVGALLTARIGRRALARDSIRIHSGLREVERIICFNEQKGEPQNSIPISFDAGGAQSMLRFF